jgi:hypothetical protein
VVDRGNSQLAIPIQAPPLEDLVRVDAVLQCNPIYLQHVLERIADHPISRINELLPWNLALPSQS